MYIDTRWDAVSCSSMCTISTRAAPRARVFSPKHIWSPHLSRAPMTPPKPQSGRGPLRPRLRPIIGRAAKDVGLLANRRQPLGVSEELHFEGGESERSGDAVGRQDASAARGGWGRALWVPAAEHEPAADQLAALPAKVQMALRTKRDARVERVAGDGREKIHGRSAPGKRAGVIASGGRKVTPREQSPRLMCAAG